MVIHIGLPDLRGFMMYGRSAPRFVGPRTPSCWFFPCAFPLMYQIAMLRGIIKLRFVFENLKFKSSLSSLLKVG